MKVLAWILKRDGNLVGGMALFYCGWFSAKDMPWILPIVLLVGISTDVGLSFLLDRLKHRRLVAAWREAQKTERPEVLP